MILVPYGKVLHINISMTRPLCPSCSQKPCAINCYRNGQIYYRSRCEQCIKRGRKIKPPNPRWKIAGYKKKPTCDRCGFKAKYSAQLLVMHLDGNLHNTDGKNLRTICQNCVIEVNRLTLPWKAGDLEPDN